MCSLPDAIHSTESTVGEVLEESEAAMVGGGESADSECNLQVLGRSTMDDYGSVGASKGLEGGQERSARATSIGKVTRADAAHGGPSSVDTSLDITSTIGLSEGSFCILTIGGENVRRKRGSVIEEGLDERRGTKDEGRGGSASAQSPRILNDPSLRVARHRCPGGRFSWLA